MSLKTKLNDLLANDKLIEALDLLMETVKKGDDGSYNTLILLKARHVANEKDNNMGIISRSDYIRTKAQNTHAFLQTMDSVPKNIIENDFEKNPFSLKELEAYRDLLEKLTDKKLYLEKETIKAYDAEKKFSLQDQIKDLERQIIEIKQKLAGPIDNKHEPKKGPTDKKRVLFICSSPTGKNPLDFGAEFKKIKDALKSGSERDLYEIEIETGVEASELINKLTYRPFPFIIHFSMHSSRNEGLYFEDANRNESPMSVENFKDIFELFASKHKPELVILSACNSIRHAEAIRDFAKYVVGTKDFFPDEIAILYAKKFYEMIFDGNDIIFAHKAAALSIKHAPIPEADKKQLKTPLHEIPVLLTQL